MVVKSTVIILVYFPDIGWMEGNSSLTTIVDGMNHSGFAK
jgi:hypothetical protein